jgi:uncharacterized membrane protein YdjX (TVP38/TMEM64 family)
MPEPPAPGPQKWGNRRWWPWLLGGLGVSALILPLAVWSRPLADLLTRREALDAWLTDLGPWGPAAIVLLEMVQTLAGPVPGTAIEAASGFLFGPWLGTLYAMSGIVSGAVIAFFLARRFGRPLVLRFLGRQDVARLDHILARGGSLMFFLLWLLPFVPDDLVCLAAGLIGMPPRRFLVLMALGRLPGIFFSVWVGATATRLSPAWWLAGLVALALLALATWRWGARLQSALLALASRLNALLGRAGRAGCAGRNRDL